MVLGAVTAALGCVVGLVAPLITLAILAIHIMAMVKGTRGERFMVPGVSEYANRF